MFSKMFKASLAVAALSLTTVASARGGHGGHHGGHGGHGGFGSHNNTFYVCRAESTTHEGIFFLGMGRHYGDAYARAFEACQRQNMTCRISCQQQF